MSNTDEDRHEPTGTYANRGIPLPGLRPAHQRLGITQRELAARADQAADDLQAGDPAERIVPANPTKTSGSAECDICGTGRGSR